MTRSAETASAEPAPSMPHGGSDRVEALVRRRWEIERRRFAATRQSRAVLAFVAVWWLVPVIEALATATISPMSFVFHLGLVLPWGLLVANPLEGRGGSTMAIDAAAGGVATMAVMATLLGHRFSPAVELRAFDALAMLPILHFELFVRPRPAIAALVGLLGLVAFGLAVLDGAHAGDAALGLVVSAAVTTVIATIAGQMHEDEIGRVHRARIRADIASHRLTHSNDELRVLSEVDKLTGLANRRAIDLRLPEIAERSQAESEIIGVMMIDVDHFKIFNDRFGHQAGDRCLTQVARATADQIRRHGDLVGRFGGEEFLAVLPGAGLDATTRVAERIRAAVEHRVDPVDAASGPVTVSIGCAAGVIGPDRTIEDLLHAADEALYDAKRSGRNRISPAPPAETGATHRSAA